MSTFQVLPPTGPRRPVVAHVPHSSPRIPDEFRTGILLDDAALARELVGHIPLGGGLIPKGAIAYAGTYLAGKGLEYLHVHDGAPSAAQREQLYQEGLERGRSFTKTLHLGANRA